MPTSEPLHVAFVWHMHQPYYRSARTGAFEMPWARVHALKDYLDMVETLSDYPDLHHTFNLVPSLVEQLEDYASGAFSDVYWDLTMKPAAELDPGERAFVVERMCERSNHLRTRLHPRYLELAQKREAAFPDWQSCAAAFDDDELRDLQVWFNLAWFDPRTLAADPLRALVEQGRRFREEDKQVVAAVQADILSKVLPAYRDAARRGQVELSTSPYFHPILPLLCNTDSARIASPDVVLPPRRFAHPNDASEQIQAAMDKHVRVFGEPPQGMWCSEQAVGEDVIPLLIAAGLSWTISDETVLARSLSGAASRVDRPATGGTLAARGSSALTGPARPQGSPYAPYRLAREQGEIAIVFRDHTLSDLIGFTYQSWASRDAAADLIHRLRELRGALIPGAGTSTGGTPISEDLPLVTIALDGENAWEYYERDGRDFLQYLYEGLSSEASLRCVTVSEHLRQSPPTRSVDWLHTGSWIGGDLRTWCGDKAHNAAWDQLGHARDLVARHRREGAAEGAERDDSRTVGGAVSPPSGALTEAWRHILIAEGSDWFWWFGDHHHTELDHVWDQNYRLHLQEVYRALGEPTPVDLFLPLLEEEPSPRPRLPLGPLSPAVDGILGDPKEWEAAGFLAPELPSTMQPASVTKIQEVRFGWQGPRLCVCIVPGGSLLGPGLEIEVRLARPRAGDDVVVRMTLEEGGGVGVSFVGRPAPSDGTEAAWKDVVEAVLSLEPRTGSDPSWAGLFVRVGRGGTTEHLFHSAGLASIGGGSS